MYGPSFTSVGNDSGIALKDIQWPAEDTGDSMLLIDPATAVYTELTYFTLEGATDEGVGDVAGWYDVTGDTPVYMGNTVITRGCAFWIYLNVGALNITTAGEVKSTFTRTFPIALYSAFCNPFPINFKLKDLNWPAEDTGDTMLLIDPVTSAYTELTYFTLEGATDEGVGEVAGWYDVTGDTPVYMGNYEFAPGQGAWVYPNNGNVTATASITL